MLTTECLAPSSCFYQHTLPDSLLAFTTVSVDALLNPFPETTPISKTLRRHRLNESQLPPLLAFIRQLTSALSVSALTLVVGLLYMRRLAKALQPAHYATSPGTAHRVFIASIMIASKYLDDEQPLTSARLARTLHAIGIAAWNSREISRMERALLTFLKFNIEVDMDAVRQLVRDNGLGNLEGELLKDLRVPSLDD
ncbi:uncharacterized protein VTP21DRAFT_4999 [Calcarisporiella thermophila]|uniref:uncharacterized protein n=1 Tax=Calcarisporiella thermophila TaxID=911321 RepID=UPI003743BACD